MHFFGKTILLLIIFISLSSANNKLTDIIVLANKEQAAKLLSTEDDYSDNWSRFDIMARTENKQGTKKELLSLMANNALEWSDAEKNKLAKAILKIEKMIADKGWIINFPARIPIIKSSNKNEGGAEGYTRQNYIVLNQRATQFEEKQLIALLIHEIFHVISRHDTAFRAKLYNLIGFKIIPEVALPNGLKERIISNPDAKQNDSYITLQVGEKVVDCLMILYAKKPYEGGTFFNYVTIGFLKISAGENKTVVLEDGKPVIYAFNEARNFFDQVGKNTRYILHGEEIMAENFVMALTSETGKPSQELLEKIDAVMIR